MEMSHFHVRGTEMGKTNQALVLRQEGIFSLKWLSEIRSAYGFVLDSSLLVKSVHFCIKQK